MEKTIFIGISSVIFSYIISSGVDNIDFVMLQNKAFLIANIVLALMVLASLLVLKGANKQAQVMSKMVGLEHFQPSISTYLILLVGDFVAAGIGIFFTSSLIFPDESIFLAILFSIFGVWMTISSLLQLLQLGASLSSLEE